MLKILLFMHFTTSLVSSLNLIVTKMTQANECNQNSDRLYTNMFHKNSFFDVYKLCPDITKPYPLLECP